MLLAFTPLLYILYKNIFEIFVQITHLKQNGFNQKAVFQSLVLACIVCMYYAGLRLLFSFLYETLFNPILDSV